MDLYDIWQFMDAIWDNIGCSNQILDNEKLSKFYSHHVWLLNGLFIEQHAISLQHRYAIANWINSKAEKIGLVLDYGGGFGTLARIIAKLNPHIKVDILEPHPFDLAIELNKSLLNVRYINSIKTKYDCLVSTDVLEHCFDPLLVLAEMIFSVKLRGFLVIANNFYPVIKCHLPCTFHLRYSFPLFAKMMGLKILGPCRGSHAHIYQKVKDKEINWSIIRKIEKISQLLFPRLEKAHNEARRIKRLLK